MVMIGVPYGKFKVFTARIDGKDVFVVKRAGKIVFKTRNDSFASRRQAAKKAEKLQKKEEKEKAKKKVSWRR